MIGEKIFEWLYGLVSLFDELRIYVEPCEEVLGVCCWEQDEEDGELKN